MSVTQCVERAFLAPSAARLRQAARALAAELVSAPATLVGLSVDAPLLADGAGIVSLSPLLRAGHVDWIAVTGANLHFDILRSLGGAFRAAPPAGESAADWVRCGEELWVAASGLRASEQALREILALPDFQRAMGTAEFHGLLGAQLHLREKTLGVEHASLLSTAQELGVPVYNPAPADGPLGAWIAELALVGNRLVIDSSVDLNEGAAILNTAAKPDSGAAVCSLGHGPAARFMRLLPGHLSAALAGGGNSPYRLALRIGCPERPDCDRDLQAAPPAADIGVPVDLSLALPLFAAYLLDRVPPRPLKRLAPRRDELLDRLRKDRLQA
ncbi:MAG: deoxyhypusine synthase family protein, partial [Candidatus Eisenbacteria bacterium]|nr:deoxyhypusine synthase family protein [Candidatus Eisenbacteria bacterium]